MFSSRKIILTEWEGNKITLINVWWYRYRVTHGEYGCITYWFNSIADAMNLHLMSFHFLFSFFFIRHWKRPTAFTCYNLCCVCVQSINVIPSSALSICIYPSFGYALFRSCHYVICLICWHNSRIGHWPGAKRTGYPHIHISSYVSHNMNEVYGLCVCFVSRSGRTVLSAKMTWKHRQQPHKQIYVYIYNCGAKEQH